MAQGYHGINQALGTVDRSTNTVVAQSVSSTTTFKSTVMNATGGMANVSYQCGVVTGTPSGSFNVWVSDDPRAADVTLWTGAIWTLAQTVGFTAGVTTVGSNSSCFVVIQNGARFSYCDWTNTTGSGTILAFASGTGG